jgi:hypothetical protein
MEHAMVKNETGTPFCLCGYLPPAPLALWAAKGETLRHVTDARLQTEPNERLWWFL